MEPTSDKADISLDFLCDLLKQAGQIALEMRTSLWQRSGMDPQAAANGMVTPYEVKADETPVTAVDRRVEDFMVGRITDRYPGQPILTEESGLYGGRTQHDGRTPSAPTTDYAWAIDPIDGTRAFASGLPIWGISAGVLRGGVPWAGGFYLPMTKELFWGTREQAYYNEHRLPRLHWTTSENALTFLAVPSNFHLHFKITYARIRSMGSTAAHLAYVASGAAVAALTRTVSLWDLAGILPLLAATGVRMAYLSGQPFEAGDLLSGNPASGPLLAAVPEVWDALAASIGVIPE